MQRNTLKLDTSAFQGLLTKLEGMGGNVKEVVNKALSEAGHKIATDTEQAISYPNLPARGKYSTGDTMRSIIRDFAVRWEGETAWIPVGFDFSKPGAGGYLISGTPKMQPDKELNRMYRQKKYMAEIQKQMSDVALDAIIQEGMK